MARRIKRVCLLLLASIFCVASQPSTAHALIRDAEIENTLRSYADPLFVQAGLNPAAIRLFIINSPKINAFVAGGANMFVHTGLIQMCETPDMLIGVMAHETGHIAGGHLARGSEKMKDAQVGALLGYVLGGIAAAATGKPEAAAAVIGGTGTSLTRTILSFSRANEEAADQFALQTLDALDISASGMVKVFTELQRNERLRPGQRDPYLLTHPLSSSRITHVRDHVQHSAITEGQYPTKFTLRHERMLAKLYGFLETPERTLLKYPPSNLSVPARLARAVAYHKMPDLERAEKELDSLLSELPKDPYINELKGQILFEHGKPAEALGYYQKAVALAPKEPLLLTDLARVELAVAPPLLESAITHLEKSTSLDDSNDMSWRLLATAYGKKGNNGMASLALAQEALLQNEPIMALAHVKQAKEGLHETSPAYQRALDLEFHAKELKKEQDEKS